MRFNLDFLAAEVSERLSVRPRAAKRQAAETIGNLRWSRARKAKRD